MTTWTLRTSCTRCHHLVESHLRWERGTWCEECDCDRLPMRQSARAGIDAVLGLLSAIGLALGPLFWMIVVGVASIWLMIALVHFHAGPPPSP